MIFTWKIFTDSGVFLGYEYAMTELSARQKAFNANGSASRYTGIGLNNILAERVN